MAAVFRKVNDDGGINGRKINFISYDGPSVSRTRKE
jgi:branched-chain amino acid transport system substrate-binding protein